MVSSVKPTRNWRIPSEKVRAHAGEIEVSQRPGGTIETAVQYRSSILVLVTNTTDHSNALNTGSCSSRCSQRVV